MISIHVFQLEFTFCSRAQIYKIAISFIVNKILGAWDQDCGDMVKQ